MKKLALIVALLVATVVIAKNVTTHDLGPPGTSAVATTMKTPIFSRATNTPANLGAVTNTASPREVARGKTNKVIANTTTLGIDRDGIGIGHAPRLK
ncbi:MAG: hypothetical protein Q7S80_02170 [bacterium]|nr:hypothetical protein [bacterium]